MRHTTGWLLIALLSLPAGACTAIVGDLEGCEQGSEDCVCIDEKTCDPGLTCASGWCYDMGGNGDTGWDSSSDTDSDMDAGADSGAP